VDARSPACMNNTVFLRLSGLMQSWGTNSKLQLRRSDAYPSKSGALGMVLCAMGVGREDAAAAIRPLVELQMGVRIDRPGMTDWDYQTAGAKLGVRNADNELKITQTTGEYEPQLSRRQYLFDASFLVALQGDPATIASVINAFRNPVWPIFLGRKCCIPSEPVLSGDGDYENVKEALESVVFTTDAREWDEAVALRAIIEHPPESKPPANATLVYDVPRTLKNPSHGPRWVVEEQIEAKVFPVGWRQTVKRRMLDYTSPQWKGARRNRLAIDNGLCVFCKSPAEDVHHVTYENVGSEKPEDLRSLCKLCHDACTQLEYGRDLKTHRIDPADPDQRQMILAQVHKLLTGRRLGRRRAIREASRASLFFDGAPGARNG
jgi:CRISPR system Cascade subunit CasD